jgi:hypothetical protein
VVDLGHADCVGQIVAQDGARDVGCAERLEEPGQAEKLAPAEPTQR